MQMMVVIDGYSSAQCKHGLSPAVECQLNPRTCPCGYAEGLDKPHYPVPALSRDYLFSVQPLNEYLLSRMAWSETDWDNAINYINALPW